MLMLSVGPEGMKRARKIGFACDDKPTSDCPCCQSGVARVRETVVHIARLLETPMQPDAAAALKVALLGIRDAGAVLLPALDSGMSRTLLEARLADFDESAAVLDEAINRLARRLANTPTHRRNLDQPLELAWAFRQLSWDVHEYIGGNANS